MLGMVEYDTGDTVRAKATWHLAMDNFGKVPTRADGPLARRWRAAIEKVGFVSPAHADSVLALSWYGIAAEKLEDVEAAETHYSRLMTMHPDHTSGYVNLGTLLYSTGRNPEAEAVFADAVERFPDDALIFVDWGDALPDGDRLAAIKIYREGKKLDPNSTEIAEALGRAYLDSYRTSIAEALVRRALKPVEPRPSTALVMGQVYLQKNQFSKAIPWFEKASDGLPKWALPITEWDYALESILALGPAEHKCSALASHYPSLRRASLRAGVALPSETTFDKDEDLCRISAAWRRDLWFGALWFGAQPFLIP